MKSDSLHPSSVILQTFFLKFELFADATDAVARMRELVLHLAVTGKLVGQDPSDESGELLLKEINAERLAAVKARQISPMKPLPAVGENELLFELQPGWAAARLIELVMEIQTGPFGSSLHKSDYQLGGIPVINPASLKGGKIVPIDEMAIGHATIKRLEVFKLNAGDIVMARRGEMGRCAIVTKNEAGWLCGTGSLVLRTPRSLFAPYLVMLIGAPMSRTYLGGASVGTTMQNLNQSILASMPVGVPPLAEQKRIVAKVDELMELCGRLEAQQQEREMRHAALARASLARFADAPTPANLNFLFHPSYTISPADLRKSILTLAIQGKLVPQDLDDEPAADTFIGLKALHKESNERSDIPNHWALCSYRSLTTLVTSGSRGWKEFYATKGSIFVRTQNIKTDRLVLEDVAFVDLPKSTEGKRAQVLKDDILITITGANVTKAARVDEQIPEAYVSQHIALTRPRWPQMSEWLHICFISHGSARGALEQLAYGDKPGLNLNNIRDLMIPIPPLAEQRRIVAKVEQLMALVDALETQLATSRVTAANLLSALVAEFTGSPEGRVASTAPVKPIVASARPNPQKATIVTARPAAQESTVSLRTLVELRKAAGLTQATVAEAMGLNQAYISQMETGKRPITEELRQKLLKIFAKKKNQHHVLQSAAT
ncbi:MAG: restriction endonuclease subunit S [Desulfomicrobium apsheronum]|nr:restriction endonuclease subunit S [Desulfomicrobium apsheronum]